jgi:chromosome segregation ATPase
MEESVPVELVKRGDKIEQKLASIEEAKTFLIRADSSGLFDSEELDAIARSIEHLSAQCEAEQTELAAALHVWQHDIDRMKREVEARASMISECASIVEGCPELMNVLAAGQARRVEKLEAAQNSIGVGPSLIKAAPAPGGALETIVENSAPEAKENS